MNHTQAGVPDRDHARRDGARVAPHEGGVGQSNAPDLRVRTRAHAGAEVRGKGRAAESVGSLTLRGSVCEVSVK